MSVMNSFLVFLTTIFMVGCSKIEEHPAMNFVINEIESTENTISFSVSSENVQNISYLVTTADKELLVSSCH